jgi:DNA-binding SARP family transcriptional activator
MSARTRFVRRLGAALAAAALLVLLALAWDLRPSMPPLPQSLSQPLPAGTISAFLDLAAWTVAVLLDLVLLGKVLQFGLRKAPGRAEFRLRRAFAKRERAPLARVVDWRAHAAPLAPPVFRVAARSEIEPKQVSTCAQGELHEPLAPVEAASGARDESPGVLLLGPFELAGCKKKHPRRQATIELIGYLAMQRRPVGRDELLEALWPGEDPRRSAARFYQAASEARKLLDAGFRRERETYSLDRMHVHVDLDELDRLEVEVAATDGDAQRAILERALELFRGEPLAEIGALWAESEQRRLSAVRADLLERVGRLHLGSGDAAGALRLAEEAAALDGSNERPVQLAMEAEAALGRREALAERYERLRRDLDERFGLEPARETRSLYRELLGQG